MRHRPCPGGLLTESVLSIFILSLFLTTLTSALDTEDFFPPFWGTNGSQFLDAYQTYGEPLNVIISGRSHPDVLSDFGFQMYARSLTFSQECLSFYDAKNEPFRANLGDGDGWKVVLMEMRQDYHNGLLGTCIEEFVGGNHLRAFRQDGPAANTSALFLSVSLEEGLNKAHTISPDGYNLGRDLLATRAANETTEYGGVVYSAQVVDVVGLMNTTTEVNHDVAVDGIIKVITVDIVSGAEKLAGTRGYADGAFGETMTTTISVEPTKQAEY